MAALLSPYHVLQMQPGSSLLQSLCTPLKTAVTRRDPSAWLAGRDPSGWIDRRTARSTLGITQIRFYMGALDELLDSSMRW